MALAMVEKNKSQATAAVRQYAAPPINELSRRRRIAASNAAHAFVHVIFTKVKNLCNMYVTESNIS
jgi:hypothetical protein